MEPLFENHYQISKELYHACAKSTQKTHRIISAVFLVILVPIFILMRVARMDFWPMGPIYIVLIAYFALSVTGLYIPLLNQRYKAFLKISGNDPSYTIRFFEEQMQVEQVNALGHHDYDTITKIYENKLAYVLMVHKTYMFMVSKDSFTIGAADDFGAFICAQTGLKIK